MSRARLLAFASIVLIVPIMTMSAFADFGSGCSDWPDLENEIVATISEPGLQMEALDLLAAIEAAELSLDCEEYYNCLSNLSQFLSDHVELGDLTVSQQDAVLYCMWDGAETRTPCPVPVVNYNEPAGGGENLHCRPVDQRGNARCVDLPGDSHLVCVEGQFSGGRWDCKYDA